LGKKETKQKMCASLLFANFVKNIFHSDKFLMNDAKDRQMNVCLHLNYLYFRQVLIKTGRDWQNWRKTPNFKFDDHMFCGTWTVVCWHMDIVKLANAFLQLLVTMFHQEQKGILQFQICTFTNVLTAVWCEKSDNSHWNIRKWLSMYNLTIKTMSIIPSNGNTTTSTQFVFYGIHSLL
jgi:hypothetical protein